MKTYKRICIKDRKFVDEDKEAVLWRGEEYITSDVKDGQVVVFSNYWFCAPVELFAGEELFTGNGVRHGN